MSEKYIGEDFFPKRHDEALSKFMKDFLTEYIGALTERDEIYDQLPKSGRISTQHTSSPKQLEFSFTTVNSLPLAGNEDLKQMSLTDQLLAKYRQKWAERTNALEQEVGYIAADKEPAQLELPQVVTETPVATAQLHFDHMCARCGRHYLTGCLRCNCGAAVCSKHMHDVRCAECVHK